jgi:hypothetical protein
MDLSCGFVNEPDRSDSQKGDWQSLRFPFAFSGVNE